MTTMRQPAAVGFETSVAPVTEAPAPSALSQLTTCFHDNARQCPDPRQIASRIDEETS